MSPNTVFANTPCYVLKSGNQPICPTINSADPGTHCICVYGFSDKPIYDKFIKLARQLLTPYPLVKRYLANQIAAANAAENNGIYLSLVILDATDPTQPVLPAATMAVVLRAQQEKARQVPVEYRLRFDPETTSYQFANESEAMPVIEMPRIVK